MLISPSCVIVDLEYYLIYLYFFEIFLGLDPGVTIEAILCKSYFHMFIISLGFKLF